MPLRNILQEDLKLMKADAGHMWYLQSVKIPFQQPPFKGGKMKSPAAVVLNYSL